MTCEEDDRVADVIGGHAELQEVAAAVVLRQILRIEAARLGPGGTDLLPETRLAFVEYIC